MRSIFQEESSLGKAVQKAWELLGNPAEFSVKILKIGESNFLGFCKTPFTICCTIKDEGNNSDNSLSVDKNKQSVDNKKQANILPKKQTSDKQPASQKVEQKQKNNNISSTTKIDNSTKQYSQKVEINTDKADDYIADDWTEDLVNVGIKFISEALLFLGHKTKVTSSKFEKNQLNLSLALTNYDSSIDRMILFALAPIIVQMVRKSTQNSIRGLRLTIDAVTKQEE